MWLSQLKHYGTTVTYLFIYLFTNTTKAYWFPIESPLDQFIYKFDSFCKKKLDNWKYQKYLSNGK